MFNNSPYTTISRGTFNIVHGNQYNTYYSGEDMGASQFLPGEEWKVELYREYDRVRLGRVKLLRTLHEEPAIICDDENWQLERGETYADSRVKRVFSTACLGDGKEESSYLSVSYTGRDAKKAFEHDCITFSQRRHASFAQLHAFNDSENPMIFFHDDLVPAQHVLENHPHCREALRYYFSMQAALITKKSSLFHRHGFTSENVWIRPHDGIIVFGPKSPLQDLLPSEMVWIFEAGGLWISDHQKPIPPLSMSLYDLNKRTLLQYLVDQFLEGVNVLRPAERLIPSSIPSRSCLIGPLRAPKNFCVMSLRPSYQRVLARFCETELGTRWYSQDCESYRQSLTNDGRIRIRFDSASDTSFPLWFTFERSLLFLHNFSLIWFAQACHVFSVLDIPRSQWSDYGIIVALQLVLTPRPQLHITAERKASTNGHHGYEPPYYLFLRPLVILSVDLIDELSREVSGANLYYWSSDPSGHSEMTERDCEAAGLPSYLLKVMGNTQTWSPKAYDIMRELQEVKGYDPSTNDFARAMGAPIFEKVSSDTEQFESVLDIDSSSSTLQAQGDADVTERHVSSSSSDFGNFDIIPPRPSLAPTYLASEMDVEMEECCSRIEDLTVEVGMEVDG